LEPASVARSISEAVTRWDVDLATDPFAVALELEQSLDYESLTQLANGLKQFAESLPSDRPLIVIIERDYAQALGQTVKGLAPSRALLVIDQVGCPKAITSILVHRSWMDVWFR
jgi:ethanolamine utilization protein EutA